MATVKESLRSILEGSRKVPPPRLVPSHKRLYREIKGREAREAEYHREGPAAGRVHQAFDYLTGEGYIDPGVGPGMVAQAPKRIWRAGKVLVDLTQRLRRSLRGRAPKVTQVPITPPPPAVTRVPLTPPPPGTERAIVRPGAPGTTNVPIEPRGPGVYGQMEAIGDSLKPPAVKPGYISPPPKHIKELDELITSHGVDRVADAVKTAARERSMGDLTQSRTMAGRIPKAGAGVRRAGRAAPPAEPRAGMVDLIRSHGRATVAGAVKKQTAIAKGAKVAPARYKGMQEGVGPMWDLTEPIQGATGPRKVGSTLSSTALENAGYVAPELPAGVSSTAGSRMVPPAPPSTASSRVLENARYGPPRGSVTDIRSASGRTPRATLDLRKEGHRLQASVSKGRLTKAEKLSAELGLAERTGTTRPGITTRGPTRVRPPTGSREWAEAREMQLTNEIWERPGGLSLSADELAKKMSELKEVKLILARTRKGPKK